jgi:hypothetical protein
MTTLAFLITGCIARKAINQNITAACLAVISTTTASPTSTKILRIERL